MGRTKTKIIQNLLLHDAGAKGVAVGRTEEGKVVMVSGGVPGDIVDVEVFKKRRKFLQGNILEIQQYSDKRTDPKCKHFGTCGGCKWQNMDYSHQLFFKQKEVENNLERISGLKDLEITPIVGAQEIYNYRNKMDFSFSARRWMTQEEIDSGVEIKNKNALGFHIPGMWSKVLHLEECHLQAEPSNKIRLFVHEYASQNDLEYFDLGDQKGFLRNLLVRNSSTGELMLIFQFFYRDDEKIEKLLSAVKEKFPEVTTINYIINDKANDTFYDLDIHTFHGEGVIYEEMEGLKFKIGSKSFFQTNSKQALTLYQLTRDFAGLTGEELVYDLYTGTGTIAQFVSKKAKKVVGIESVEEAVTAAKENAKNNGIENCEFYCGDMKSVLDESFVEKHGVPDVVITDPPRDGMHKKVVENIILMSPKRIVYVSCNSATQARDLEILKEHYKVVKVQPVDMFPQTHHVENIVLLEKI